MYATALFVIGLGVPGIVSAATFAVIGQIPCHGSLRLVKAGQSMQVAASNRSITLRPAATEGGSLPVVLSLRTNCPYQIAAASDGGSDKEAHINVPTAANGTGYLIPVALQATSTAAELKSGTPAVGVEGQAVSRGGNDATAASVGRAQRYRDFQDAESLLRICDVSFPCALDTEPHSDSQLQDRPTRTAH